MRKIKLSNFPKLIQNDAFNTIDFILIYPTTYKEEDMFYLNLLCQNITNSSKQYPSEQQFKREAQKRFIIDYKMKTIHLNTNIFIQVSLRVPNPKKVKSFDLDSAFEFFMDMIYHPNVTDGVFDSYQFQREKNFIKDSLENSTTNIYSVGYQNFLTYVDENGILKNNLYHNQHLLANVSEKRLYEFYQKSILKNTPCIIVYGDIEEQKVYSLFSKYIDLTPKEIEIHRNYECYLIPRSETQYIEENSSFNQSALYMGYKVKDMKRSDTIYLRVLSRILEGSENNLLFNTLRLEHNLVYDVRLSSFFKTGLLFIETYLKDSSKEEAIRAVCETLEKLRDADFVKACLDKIILANTYHLIRQKDSKYSVVNEYIDACMDIELSLEEIYAQYKQLDIQKFIEFLDRFILDTVYFLRGEPCEK